MLERQEGQKHPNQHTYSNQASPSRASAPHLYSPQHAGPLYHSHQQPETLYPQQSPYAQQYELGHHHHNHQQQQQSPPRLQPHDSHSSYVSPSEESHSAKNVAGPSALAALAAHNESLPVPEQESEVPTKSSTGKSFQCTGYDGCTMSFSRSEHLARHVRKHTGEKPFTCRCGKKFTRLDNLRQHASTIHADEPEQNEELFTRLAATMPRSGRATRRKSSQTKRTASDTRLPAAQAAGIVQDEPPLYDASPPGIQPGMGQHALPAPESFLPPFPPHQLADLSVSTRHLPSLPGPNSISGLASQSTSSASFRFPAVGGHDPYPTQDSSRYTAPLAGPSDYSASQQYPFNALAPNHYQASSSHHLQHPQPEQHYLYPSQAQDSGRDGSSFRSTASTRLCSPTGIQSSRAEPSDLRTYASDTSTSIFPYSADTQQHDTFDGTYPSPQAKPVLPSLSSLIAGAPALSLSVSTAQELHHADSARRQSVSHGAGGVDISLLAAAELATSAARPPFRTASIPSFESRSSSLSSSASSLPTYATAATSPSIPSPSLHTLQSRQWDLGNFTSIAK